MEIQRIAERERGLFNPPQTLKIEGLFGYLLPERVELKIRLTVNKQKLSQQEEQDIIAIFRSYNPWFSWRMFVWFLQKTYFAVVIISLHLNTLKYLTLTIFYSYQNTGVDKNTKEFVAIKLEKEDNEDIRSLDREVQILSRLQGLSNVPKLFWSGQENNYNIMVLSLLGRDLAYYMKALKKYSLKTVLMLMD